MLSLIEIASVIPYPANVFGLPEMILFQLISGRSDTPKLVPVITRPFVLTRTFVYLPGVTPDGYKLKTFEQQLANIQHNLDTPVVVQKDNEALRYIDSKIDATRDQVINIIKDVKDLQKSKNIVFGRGGSST